MISRSQNSTASIARDCAGGGILRAEVQKRQLIQMGKLEIPHGDEIHLKLPFTSTDLDGQCLSWLYLVIRELHITKIKEFVAPKRLKDIFYSGFFVDYHPFPQTQQDVGCDQKKLK